MKLLAVSAILCAMMALSTAAAEEASKGTEAPTGEHHINKRATSCPWGWIVYDSQCFRYFPIQCSWAQAQRFCQSRNANLASVHDLNEYHYIQQLIFEATHRHGRTWIGGSDCQQDSYWFWSDGTPFTYSNWCHGEPNNDGGQACLIMNHNVGKCWDDEHCQQHHPFVCAMKI